MKPPILCHGGSLFQSLIRENVNGYADGEQDEEQAEGPMLGNEDGAVEQRKPHHADGQDLYLQRNGLMYHEVLNVRSQLRVVHQPVIQPLVTTQEKRCREQKQRSGWQHRQKYAQYRQPKGYKSEKNKQPLHSGCKNSNLILIN